LELGLGAGWMPSDYAQSGIPFDPPATRIDRLAEAVAILKQLFGDSPCEFAGDHYRVRGLDGTPKPLQRPHPPILIGGGGKRVLALAAREADIVGLSPSMASGAIDAATAATGTAEATDKRVAWIRDVAAERWEQIELHVRVHVVAVTDRRDELAEALAPGLGLTPQQALDSPHALAGTVEQIVDTLLERRERWGLSAIGVGVDALEALAPVVARLAGT
ncbi:MAG TPA: TIGR03621 family F420-dependent LLM class oxidoreductase, partial [Acidimicrobiales bacterium]